MNVVFLVLLLLPCVLGSKHPCPGGSFQCDDSSTCCQLLDKTYGCCPMKDAVCCDDHIHCCPINTKCSTGMCIQQDLTLTNVTGHRIRAKDVVCPGSQLKCPDQTTCCESFTPGVYGCCPMEDAVCCTDKIHCCPSGTTCNLPEQTCDGDNFIAPMYDSGKTSFKNLFSPIVQLHRFDTQESSVVCPGSSFQCPNGYTCCQLQSGEWGCCPFPKASCCNDRLHCCPENMQCDDTSQFCRQGLHTATASARKVPATIVAASAIVCPDKSSCQDSMTCCLISDSQYGCCQYANATCCSDKLHCCPSGNTCDVKNKRCVPEGNWLLNMI